MIEKWHSGERVSSCKAGNQPGFVSVVPTNMHVRSESSFFAAMLKLSPCYLLLKVLFAISFKAIVLRQFLVIGFVLNIISFLTI